MAVLHPASSALKAHVTKIYGPPGTGKTTKLIALLKDEIKRGTARKSIAYISHTRAANEVIIERLQDDGVIGSNAARDAPWFRTIHSACLRLIGGQGSVIVPRYDYRRFTRQEKLILSPDDIADVLYSQRTDDYSVVLAAYSLAANRMCSIEEAVASMEPNPLLVPTKREYFMKRWREFKKHEGKVDFLDMLTQYAEGDYEPLPCSVVFIDEAQDLSDLQWKIVMKMCQRAERIYIAGDDDQAIYGFIGGSEFGFYRFPAHEEIVLEQSYRVPRVIGEQASQVIQSLKERKQKNVRWLDKPGSVELFPHGEFELDWRAWRAENKSVMFLHRHRKGQNDAASALRDFGVPHLSAGESLVETDEGKAFCAVLRLRMGEVVRPNVVADLYKLAGDRVEEKRVRSLGAKDRKLMLSIKDVKKLPLQGNWYAPFVNDNRHAARIFSDLDRILHRGGAEALLSVPNVHISTMHAAKGKEADVVIISPDCNEVVKKNMNLPAEVRLAYVALTRAKEKVIVFPNRTGQEITHFRRK